MKRVREIDLDRIAWPACLLSCNELLRLLAPGEKIIISVRDNDLIENVLLLINNQSDLRYSASRESGSCRITVHRRFIGHADGAIPSEQAEIEGS